MFKILFSYIVPLVVVLVAAIVGYNYFLGNEQEQEDAQELVSKVTGLGKEVFDLLASEKEKFEAGKYNDAMEKIGAGITQLKEEAGELADGGQQFLDRLNQLEREKQDLENQLAELKQNETGSTDVGARSTGESAPVSEDNRVGASAGSQSQRQAEQIQERINNLARETEQIGIQIRG